MIYFRNIQNYIIRVEYQVYIFGTHQMEILLVHFWLKKVINKFIFINNKLLILSLKISFYFIFIFQRLIINKKSRKEHGIQLM